MVLQLLTFLLGLATVFVVVMSGVLLVARGSLTIDAQADSPYTVVSGPLTDDRAELAPYVEVQNGQSVTLGNWSNRLTSPAFDGPPRVDVTVEVGSDDADTRAVVLVMGDRAGSRLDGADHSVAVVALLALAEVFAVGTTSRSESPDAPIP